MIKQMLFNMMFKDNNLLLSKELVKKSNLSTAGVYAILYDKWLQNNKKEFVYTIDNLSKDARLSDRKCREAIKFLVENGYIIKTKFEGCPQNNFIKSILIQGSNYDTPFRY